MCKMAQVIETHKTVNMYSLLTQLICCGGYLNPFGWE